jgi:hypothetical protein
VSATLGLNPTLANNPTVLATLGAASGLGGSIAGDAVNGRDIDAGKATISALAGAVGTPVGAKAGDIAEGFFGAASSSILGEVLGASATEGAALGLNVGTDALSEMGNEVSDTVKDGIQGVEDHYRNMADCVGNSTRQC